MPRDFVVCWILRPTGAIQRQPRARAPVYLLGAASRLTHAPGSYPNRATNNSRTRGHSSFVMLYITVSRT